MANFLATALEVEALPVGTRYRILTSRVDLFGGKLVIECDQPLGLPAGPNYYPNGVSILKGNGAEWQTIPAPKDPLPSVTDAEILRAISFRKLSVPPAGKVAEV